MFGQKAIILVCFPNKEKKQKQNKKLLRETQQEAYPSPLHLRCKKQSYLKQRRQNSVWNECMVRSRETLSALTPSILGVHSCGRSGS